MKKVLVIMSVILILLVSVSGCKKDEGIAVWSFTDELEDMITNYFVPANPDFKFTYTLTPTEQFESRLDPVLASGRGAPDVFAVEAGFVRKYIESGLLLDITDIYERNRSKLLQYPVEVGTYNGRVYGMSWQACPGGVFYRRSLARQYLGSDDPAVVQSYLSDFSKFLDTARLLGERSNGRCVIVSSTGDLSDAFYSARQQPWVVNGRLVIDPVLDQYLELVKTLRENRWEGRVGTWGEGWFAGMNDALRDENGNPIEVFSYFLPTWGLHYVLKNNAPDTAGDWALCEGPIGWSGGGTWIAAWKDTKNPEAAKEMIEWLTTNDGFLRNWALDKGDFVSNMSVVNSIKDSFVEPFLGGQNHYAQFAAAALLVDGRLKQGTDSAIQGLFNEAVTAYMNSEKTKEQALADFRQAVQAQLGIN